LGKVDVTRMQAKMDVPDQVYFHRPLETVAA